MNMTPISIPRPLHVTKEGSRILSEHPEIGNPKRAELNLDQRLFIAIRTREVEPLISTILSVRTYEEQAVMVEAPERGIVKAEYGSITEILELQRELGALNFR